MTKQTRAVLNAALALPEDERVLLLETLLDQLSPEPDELTDDELFAELQRRRTEVQAGTAEGIPWSELIQED